MKRSRIKTLVIIGLGFLAPAPASLPAQSQSTVTATGPLADSSERLEELQQRLDRVKSRLVLDRQRLADASPEMRRALSRELDDLQEELDHLKAELASIRLRQEEVAATSNSAPGNCCQSTSAECCKRRETGLRNGPGAKEAASESVCTTTASRVRSCRTQVTLTESGPMTGVAIHLMNDQGQLRRGQNGFCIHFSSLRDGTMPEVGKVQVDFTRDLGQIRGIRAIARLTQTERGRYCGQVNLGMTGPWHVTIKYEGPAGRAKAVFLAAVN